jgi:hypothetical protein
MLHATDIAVDRTVVGNMSPSSWQRPEVSRHQNPQDDLDNRERQSVGMVNQDHEHRPAEHERGNGSNAHHPDAPDPVGENSHLRCTDQRHQPADDPAEVARVGGQAEVADGERRREWGGRRLRTDEGRGLVELPADVRPDRADEHVEHEGDASPPGLEPNLRKECVEPEAENRREEHRRALGGDLPVGVERLAVGGVLDQERGRGAELAAGRESLEQHLSLQDARLNTVMKELTAWAAIIAVRPERPLPGVRAGVGFVLSEAVIVGIALPVYVSFKQRDWL